MLLSFEQRLVNFWTVAVSRVILPVSIGSKLYEDVWRHNALIVPRIMVDGPKKQDS